jgi:hypothetical protein
VHPLFHFCRHIQLTTRHACCCLHAGDADSTNTITPMHAEAPLSARPSVSDNVVDEDAQKGSGEASPDLSVFSVSPEADDEDSPPVINAAMTSSPLSSPSSSAFPPDISVSEGAAGSLQDTRKDNSNTRGRIESPLRPPRGRTMRLSPPSGSLSGHGSGSFDARASASPHGTPPETPMDPHLFQPTEPWRKLKRVTGGDPSLDESDSVWHDDGGYTDGAGSPLPRRRMSSDEDRDVRGGGSEAYNFLNADDPDDLDPSGLITPAECVVCFPNHAAATTDIVVVAAAATHTHTYLRTHASTHTTTSPPIVTNKSSHTRCSRTRAHTQRQVQQRDAAVRVGRP